MSRLSLRPEPIAIVRRHAVRKKNGQCTDRTTGNIVAAMFRHDKRRGARPALTDTIALSSTRRLIPIEKQWKALQNDDMLAAKFY